MIRFFAALAVTLFFYARMDILIWQRIFEAQQLVDVGIGVYHWGWAQALFGFMALGALLFYPNRRRMLAFPLSLALLAFSGAEDLLYYWLDGRTVPAELPWLAQNPLLLQPVTAENLQLSAGLWLAVVVALEIGVVWLGRRRGSAPVALAQGATGGQQGRGYEGGAEAQV